MLDRRGPQIRGTPTATQANGAAHVPGPHHLAELPQAGLVGTATIGQRVCDRQ